MKAWVENYGEDADRNRGVMTLFSELDDSPEERMFIVSKLADDFEADWQLDLTKVIKDMCIPSDCGEGEFEHNVDPLEYAWEVYNELKLRLDGSEHQEFIDLLQEFKLEAFKTKALDQHFGECVKEINGWLDMKKRVWRQQIRSAAR